MLVALKWFCDSALRRYLVLEELRKGYDCRRQAHDPDDMARPSRGTPDLAPDRMTNHDIAFNSEGQNQPDSRVAERVYQLSADGVVVTFVDIRGPDVKRLVMRQTHREDQTEVHDVAERQRGQVPIRRGLHRASRQHGDVDEVPGDSTGDDEGCQDALDDEASRR